MLIEIVQHEANKVVREATLEEAKAFRHNFPVNIVDSEGNRTPFELDEHGEFIDPSAKVTEEVPADQGETSAAEPASETADTPAEGAAATDEAAQPEA